MKPKKSAPPINEEESSDKNLESRKDTPEASPVEKGVKETEGQEIDIKDRKESHKTEHEDVEQPSKQYDNPSFLTKKLSTEAFVISMVLIFVLGLVLIIIANFILNKDFKKTDLSNYLPVTTEPLSFDLMINNPDNNTIVNSKSVVVSGKTSPKASIIISSESGDTAFEANQKGEFSKVVSLVPGLNILIIQAFDPQGNTKSVQKTLYYSEEKI